MSETVELNNGWKLTINDEGERTPREEIDKLIKLNESLGISIKK